MHELSSEFMATFLRKMLLEVSESYRKFLNGSISAEEISTILNTIEKVLVILSQVDASQRYLMDKITHAFQIVRDMRTNVDKVVAEVDLAKKTILAELRNKEKM